MMFVMVAVVITLKYLFALHPLLILINNRKKSTKLSVEYCHLISKCIGNRAVRGEWRGLALGSLCYEGKIMKFKE